MVLLQTILILIIVYYIFKILWKWFSPYLLNYAVKKTEERFGQQFAAPRQTTQKPQNEGETSVFTRPNSKRKTTKKVGEYTDFEEIE